MNTESIKKMCRLLEMHQRFFFDREYIRHKNMHTGVNLTARQINHLRMIRFTLPCNLQNVMYYTGLSSSAASIFIDKLVSSCFVKREEDPRDRRNIIIKATPETEKMFAAIDQGFDEFIEERSRALSVQEQDIVSKASKLICRHLEFKGPGK